MSGQWVERPLEWHDTTVLNCRVCGRLITRRWWAFDGGGGELHVCSPDCEELYDSYWKPTYGVMVADADR
jgi:hypothetical protein